MWTKPFKRENNAKRSLSLFILRLRGLLLVSVTAVFATPDLPPSPNGCQKMGSRLHAAGRYF